jgi:hypothetical protein
VDIELMHDQSKRARAAREALTRQLVLSATV